MAEAAYIEFPVYDTTDRPTEFKDGLPTYVKVVRDWNEGTTPPLE